MGRFEKTKYAGVSRVKTKTGYTYYITYRPSSNSNPKKIKAGSDKDGFTARQAFLMLEDIKHGEYIEETNLKSQSERFTLKNLKDIYFQRLYEKSETEEFKDDTDKTHKTIKNIKKEESIWKNVWSKWELNNIPLKNIKPKDVYSFLNDFHGVRSQNTIYNDIMLIKSILKHTNDLYRGYNPFSEVKVSKQKNSQRKEFLTPIQLKKYLEELKKENHTQAYLISLILISTGMRPDSCKHLKVEDINFHAKKINTYDFKRKIFYDCILTEQVKEELEPLLKDRPNQEYLFSSKRTEKGKPLQELPRVIQTILDRLFNKNKIGKDRIVPYTFRHSFATNLLLGIEENGIEIVKPVPIFKVQRLMNHADVSTTIKNYSKFIPDFAENSIKGYLSVIL